MLGCCAVWAGWQAQTELHAMLDVTRENSALYTFPSFLLAVSVITLARMPCIAFRPIHPAHALSSRSGSASDSYTRSSLCVRGTIANRRLGLQMRSIHSFPRLTNAYLLFFTALCRPRFASHHKPVLRQSMPVTYRLQTNTYSPSPDTDTPRP
jgi:hypothetical protein